MVLLSPLRSSFIHADPCLASPLFLDLKDEEAEVDVFGSQQLVALHAVADGQRSVLCFIGVVGEDVVLDDWFDFDVLVWALQEQEGALQRRVHFALQDELEGERAFAGQVGVAFRVVDPCLQHPGLVEHSEARRLVVQSRDEVVGAVWPELHLWSKQKLQRRYKFAENNVLWFK